MWVLKFKGETFYVEHVNCTVPWSTKETKENIHTKGSIKIKNCLLVIDDENCANISELTIHDKNRLRNREKGITRVITSYGHKLRDVLGSGDIKHGPIKTIGGACSTTFYIVEILKESHVSYLLLNMIGSDIRILKENEGYYKLFDDAKYLDKHDIDEEELWGLYEEDEEDEDEGMDLSQSSETRDGTSKPRNLRYWSKAWTVSNIGFRELYRACSRIFRR